MPPRPPRFRRHALFTNIIFTLLYFNYNNTHGPRVKGKIIYPRTFFILISAVIFWQ
jgi:hypothetical protein